MPVSPWMQRLGDHEVQGSYAFGTRRMRTPRSSRPSSYTRKQAVQRSVVVCPDCPLRYLNINPQTTVVTKKNPFKISSILTPDPSSSLAQSLVMQGRTLDVTRAVTREEAGRLRELGEKQREKKDKRNLYLMREGGKFKRYQGIFSF